MRRELRVIVYALLVLAAPRVAIAQAQENFEMTERAAARALLDNRLTPERSRALSLALELGPSAGPELRAAVIAAAWAEVRGAADRAEDDESIFAYYDAVAALRDPRAIPFLVRVLPAGPGAANALADLGAVAFPAVLETARQLGEHPKRIEGGLTALRFMLEDGSLGVGELERVREVTRSRLSGTQDELVVMSAMRLAIALGDGELRQIVERLASSRAAVEALVSPHWPSGERIGRPYLQDYLDGVQERAHLLLAGQASEIGPFRQPWPHK